MARRVVGPVGEHRGKKPRTNEQTAQYWADSILANERAPYIQVNSVIVDNDVIYSFGRHFPMGVIERDSRGRTKRVLLNTDRYGQGGWANTNGDLSDVHTWARDAVLGSPREIEIRKQLLSAYRTNGMIQTRPREDDPEPESNAHMVVPKVFTATDPGPEPIKSPEGCIAGERYGASKYERQLMWTREIRAMDPERPIELDENTEHPGGRGRKMPRTRHLLAYIDEVLDGNDMLWVRTWVTTWTEFGEESWRQSSPDGAKYEKCPHCKEFDRVHQNWSLEMNGGYDHARPRGHRTVPGYKVYCEMMERFGSQEAWREARRLDWHRVRNARRAYSAWSERNHIPHYAVPTDERGIIKLDANGYPFRKDEDEYRAAKRLGERHNRRRQREIERQEREQREIERFHARMQKARDKRRARTFEAKVEQLVITVRTLNESLRVEEGGTKVESP